MAAAPSTAAPRHSAAIARADAGGLEALQVLEPDRQLFGLERVELSENMLGDLLERRREVAVVVERVDQRGDDLAVAQRQVEQRQLLDQVIAQRAGRDLLRIEVVVLVGCCRRRPSRRRCAAAVVREVGDVRQVVARRRGIDAVSCRRCRRRHRRRASTRSVVAVRRAVPGQRELLRRRVLVAVLALEQRILLQHPLDLRR